NHISTDYKCPVIAEFRGRLIEELKRNPERLPSDVQFFIPSSYRYKYDRSNIIYNRKSYEQQIYHQQTETPNFCQACIFMQQCQQSQEQMIYTMSKAVSSTMFQTSAKMTEVLHLLTLKIKKQFKDNSEFDEAIQQLNSQMLFIQETHSEYCKYQEEMTTLSKKQNEFMKNAVDSFYQFNNV
ncbi:unnamed protein product, partial [Didymodactylos carnosus]